MKNKIILITIFSCLIMAFFDLFVVPPYALKSLIKIIVFFAIPIVLLKFNLKSALKISKKHFIMSILFGFFVYFIILFAYLLARNFFDFSNIAISLQNEGGINSANFLFVSLYISFINSLLEEFFFRGFSFLHIKKFVTRKFAYIFSSLLFALYHITIVLNWVSPVFVILITLLLFLSGLLFNFLDEKIESIYPSWFVHMFANFSINTIGFSLLGII